jgi:hypothetical protein
MDPEGFFPLIVRGGRNVAASHDGSTLTVRFSRSPVAAGDPSTFGRMPLGSAAWLDRPLNDAEPTMLRQQMSSQDAEGVVSILHINDRFMKFICANTNMGHFQVHRNEPAFMQVKIDQG